MTKPIFIEPGEFDSEPPSWGTPPSALFCAVDECPNNAGFLGLPLCEACAWNVWLTVEDFGSPSRKAAARELIRGRGVEEGERRGAAHEVIHEIRYGHVHRQAIVIRQSIPGWVYYLRVGDLIKIGWSADIKKRLKAYPPNAELLGAQVGTRQDEAAMHGKFISLLAKGREWFHPGSQLLEHIAAGPANYNTLRAILREEAAGKKRDQAARLAEARANRPHFPANRVE